jgi:hypothetical protein
MVSLELLQGRDFKIEIPTKPTNHQLPFFLTKKKRIENKESNKEPIKKPVKGTGNDGFVVLLT